MTRYQLPPGPRGLPFIGSTVLFRKDRLGFLTQVYRDYGPTTTIRFGTTPGVMVTRPSALRELCVHKASQFSKGDFSDNRFLFSGDTLRLHHGTDKKNFRGCCGCGQEKSMMSMDGDMYESQRTVVGEAFHGPAIERYRGIMVSLTRQMLDSWTPGQEIELTSEMQKLSASVVFQTLFGVDVQDRSDAIVKAYSGVLRHTGRLFQLFKSDSDIRKETAWKNLMTLVDEIVKETAARPRETKNPLLVDMILRGAPANRTNDVIRDQITAFLGAGQVTVAGALIWVVSLLMQHPKVLGKVTQEVQSVLGGAAPEITDLPQMTYLDWIIKETLRLFPAVWQHGRRAIADVEIDGYLLPKGTFVFFSEWVTHRADEYFGEASKFIPERFAQGSPYKHTADAYIPWGMGPRACIGGGFATVEMKVVLSMMLQRFTPVLIDRQEQLTPTPRSILLQPRGEVKMRVDKAPILREIQKTMAADSGMLRCPVHHVN